MYTSKAPFSNFLKLEASQPSGTLLSICTGCEVAAPGSIWDLQSPFNCLGHTVAAGAFFKGDLDLDTVRLRRAPILLRCGFAMPSVFLTATVSCLVVWTGQCGKLFSRRVEGLAHLSSPFFAFLVACVLA